MRTDSETVRCISTARPQRSTVDLLAAALELDETVRKDFVVASRGWPGAKKRSRSSGRKRIGGRPSRTETSAPPSQLIVVAIASVVKAIRDKFEGSVAEANVLAAEKAHEYVDREKAGLAARA